MTHLSQAGSRAVSDWIEDIEAKLVGATQRRQHHTQYNELLRWLDPVQAKGGRWSLSRRPDLRGVIETTVKRHHGVIDELWEMTREQAKRRLDRSDERRTTAVLEVEDALQGFGPLKTGERGREAFVRLGWMNPDETVRQWLDRKARQGASWVGNRKTGETGTQELSQKYRYSVASVVEQERGKVPEAYSGERVRKAALAYIEGYRADWRYPGEEFWAWVWERAVKEAISDGRPVSDEIRADLRLPLRLP